MTCRWSHPTIQTPCIRPQASHRSGCSGTLGHSSSRRNFGFRVQGWAARILVDLRRGDELGQVLEQIMSRKVQRDSPDIGRERDFVDAAPGLISEDILARYDKFCPERAGDSPHEPPKFEPPEWGLDGEEARVPRAR